MSDSSSSSSSGIGVFGLLGVCFVMCKILGIAPIVGWSWWWVTAPFWVGFAIIGVIILVMLVPTIILEIIEAIRN